MLVGGVRNLIVLFAVDLRNVSRPAGRHDARDAGLAGLARLRSST